MMSEAPRVALPLMAVAGYGLQLATSLQLYAEGLSDTNEKLVELSVDIHATASALIQIQEAVNIDQNNDGLPNFTKIFKHEGLEEINNIVAQCVKIYKTIVIVVTKAGTAVSRRRTAESFGEMPVLRAASFIRTLRWGWLEPRVKRIQEQVKWLKMKVLLNLQLAGIAKIQLGIPERAPGNFDEELALRALATRIKKREVRYLERLANKYRLPEQLVDSPHNTSAISIPDIPVIPNERPDVFSGGIPKLDDLSPPPCLSKTDGTTQTVGTPLAVAEIKDTLPTVPVPNPPAAPCSTRSNTMVNDQDDNPATLLKGDTKKLGVEEVKLVCAPNNPTETQDSQPTPKEDKIEDESPGNEQAKDKEPAAPSISDFKSTSSIFPGWFSGIFGQSTKLANDWESQTLEAYILPENSQTLLRVPFGHQNLTQGLKRMKKQCIPWDQYTALGSQHHKRISQAVLEAKRLDSRERTCISVSLNKEYGAERIMLFFLVGVPVEPIHFKDAVGRKFTFPYEQARTWPLMKALIDQAFLHVEGLGTHVNEGHYDLLMEGIIIIPDVFEQSVKPGCSISQHMWPMPNKRPGPGGPGPGIPFAGGPPAPPIPRNNCGPPPPPGMTGPSLPAPPVLINVDGPPNILDWMKGGSSSVNSSVLASDSDIEDEPEDLGLEIAFGKEEENSKLNLGELLGKFTNATDTVHEVFNDDNSSDSDDDSDGSRSLVSD